MGFFGQNPKISAHWEAQTLCQKSEQSYERISRSPPDEGTNRQTHRHTHERDLIGPNLSTGDQKSTKFNKAFGRYKLKY